MECVSVKGSSPPCMHACKRSTHSYKQLSARWVSLVIVLHLSYSWTLVQFDNGQS